MHDVVVNVVHPGNGRDRRAGLFTGFDNLGFKLPAIAAPPCAGRIKIDRVHVSTYFYVDTIFLPGLLAINVYGPDAYIPWLTFFFCQLRAGGVALSLKCAGHKGRCFSRRPWLCRFGKYRPNMLARLEPGKSKPIPTCTTANMRIMWCPKAGQDDNLGRRAPSQSHFWGLADNTQIGVELVWGKAPVSVLAAVSS